MKLPVNFILVIASMILLSLMGCGKRQPYSTSTIKTELEKLKTQKLCVVSFFCNPDISVQGGSVLTGLLRKAAENEKWEKSISDKLNKSYFDKLISHFEKKFVLIKTDYESAKNQIDVTDTDNIVDAMAQTDAEIGLIANSKFGWQWASADAGISYYNIKTHISLVNKKGVLIWDFNSYALIQPPLSVEGALSGITATTPSDGKILADYAEFFQYYPRVIAGLIGEDIDGKQHGSKFDDYVTKGTLKSTIVLSGK